MRRLLLATLLVAVAGGLLPAVVDAAPTAPHAAGVVLATPGARDGTAASVSCPPDGGCTAVGGYQRTPSERTAVAWLRGSGGWGAPHAVQLPAGVPSSAWSSFTSVSCSHRGTCLLVGTYHVLAADERAMAVLEVHGVLRRAVTLRLPVGERASNLFAACQASDDRCVVVGTMHLGGGNSRLYESAVSLTAPAAHQIGPAVRIPFVLPSSLPTPNDGGSIFAYALACVDDVDCIVVGQLNWGVISSLGFTQLEVHGHWGPVRLAPLPSDAQPLDTQTQFLYGVACAAAAALVNTPCVAVGGYASTTGSQPLVERFVHGAFRAGTRPSTSPATLGYYDAVSCESVHHHCTAVGVLYDLGIAGSESGRYSLGTVAGFTSSALVAVPVSGAEGLVTPAGISCPAGQATCVAVGDEEVAPPQPPIADVVP